MTFDDHLDPFEPAPETAPKKRGRPAGQTKPKAAAKPRWKISTFRMDDLIGILRELAIELEPDCAGNNAKQLRVAAELLEMIETKKA